MFVHVLSMTHICGRSPFTKLLDRVESKVIHHIYRPPFISLQQHPFLHYEVASLFLFNHSYSGDYSMYISILQEGRQHSSSYLISSLFLSYSLMQNVNTNLTLLLEDQLVNSGTFNLYPFFPLL